MVDIQHKNITGADAAHPPFYASESDPTTTLGAYRGWFKPSTKQAWIRNAANSAWLDVKVTGISLDDLTDVDTVSAAPTDGQALVWDAGDSEWVPGSVSGGGSTSDAIWEPVRVATTANVTLSSPGASIDGTSLTSGDRVLVWQQSTASQNGIYVWNGAASAMTRATDADASGEFIDGRLVAVRHGSRYHDYTFIFSALSDPFTLGSTGVDFIWSGGNFVEDMGDVDVISAPPSNGQTLVWDDSSGFWVPGSVAAGSVDAVDVAYAGGTGMSATNAEAALDELATEKANVTDLTDHITDTSAAHAASAISYAGGTGMSATNVESAIDELATEKSDATSLTAHLNDTSDAHDASAISYAGGTGMSATDVEAAIDELATEKTDDSALTAHIADATDAHDASAISILDAAAQYTATEVEGALAEVLDALQAHEADTSDAHDASAISILDAGGDFTATDVEGALAELFAGGGGGGVADLDDLTDVVITSPATDDVLVYNGTSWVNDTSPGGSAPEAMHVLGTGGEPALQNSWATFGTSSPGFYKHEERVYLQGMIASGTTSTNTVLFTLPAGYRPAASQFFTTTSRSGSSTYVTGNIEVATNGDVMIKTGGNNCLALNGVNFRV